VANLDVRFKDDVSASRKYGINIDAVSDIFNLVANLDVRFKVVVSKVEPPACDHPLLAVL
jgi:hypothetical protein